MNGVVRTILENINFIRFSKMLHHLKEKKKLKLVNDSFCGIPVSAGTLRTRRDSKKGKKNHVDG